MDPDTWKWTLIDSLSPALGNELVLSSGEIPIVSCYLGTNSWYAMTTSRVAGHNDLGPYEFDPRAVASWQWGDFKGSGLAELEVLKAKLQDERCIELTY